MLNTGYTGSVVNLRTQVEQAYSALAVEPNGARLSPNGRELALALGYPDNLLARLPKVCLDAFYGVAPLGWSAMFQSGSRVLDVGCGSGLDTLCLAHQVGPGGTVVGVDFSPAMLTRAGQAVAESGCQNVTLQRADAEALPWPEATFDGALVNGLFNLNPARESIFRELARVVRPGGTLWAAELIATAPTPDEPPDPLSWFT